MTLKIRGAGYSHKQEHANTVWSIPHNLDRTNVLVDVFVNWQGGLQKILPKSVSPVDSNTLRVEFSVPLTGEARVN